MRIRVRLFAGHRERVGSDSLEVNVPDGSSVGTVFEELSRLHPSIGETGSFTTFARNRRVVDREEPLNDGDEVALLQPVSGGAGPFVRVQARPLSIDECVDAVQSPECGGTCVFLGMVRDNYDGTKTDHLEYDAYAEMAVEVIVEIVAEADRQWPVGKTAVQHRTGELHIGEISVIVAVSAPHRAEAFAACRYIIDELKARAPIWKKEFGELGDFWVGGPGEPLGVSR